MINLTDNALRHLNTLSEKHNKKYVRLSVKGGGCAGFGYDWSFENSIPEMGFPHFPMTHNKRNFSPDPLDNWNPDPYYIYTSNQYTF